MKLFNIIDTAFENFDNTITSYLSKVFNNIGLSYNNSNVIGIIFNAIKGIMQNVMFYIEDAFTEQNIYTAERQKSVYSLAKISGFEPSYGMSAGGVITARLLVNNGIDKQSDGIIYLKNHTTIVNKSTGYIYSIILPTDYYVFNVTNPLLQYQLKIQQGLFNTSRYSANGNELEAVHINNISLFDRRYIKVTVNGEEYMEVSSLYDMSENGKEYIYSVGYNNSFDIIFGNGTYGKKLNFGDVVIVEYLTHQGINGNILSDDQYEFIFADSLIDTLGNSINGNDFITLSMNNSICGGMDSDTIELIRNMVGNNSRSLIYSSADNMKLFLKRFSFIGYNNCYSSMKYNKIYIIALQNVETKYKNDIYKYLTLSNTDLLLNEQQQEMVINTLDNSNKTLAGFSIEFITPIFRKYALICYVKTTNKFNREKATQIINETLTKYFINLSYDVKFIAKSTLISIILNADEDKIIESIDIDIISEYNENAYANDEYIEYYEDIDSNELSSSVIKKYDSDTTLGLDQFGNISLNTIVEIPRLCGGFNYYIDKTNKIQNESIKVKAIDIIFI